MFRKLGKFGGFGRRGRRLDGWIGIFGRRRLGHEARGSRVDIALSRTIVRVCGGWYRLKA